MHLYLHNTLTGKKEEFTPITEGAVRLYHCGPTVYNFAHIGNLRAYIFTDTLRRTLEYNKYKIKQVMNITDVGHLTSDADDGEDKMVKALKRDGKPFTLEGMREVADTYTRAFKEDLKALNILTPHEMPRASEHISEDIELVQELEKKGFAYRINDGIYFDTSKFPTYGKLGTINLEGLKAGARVEVKDGKRSPIDFTLWKFGAPGLPAFPSPLGDGFPGWHVECSAMSREYLGQPFDIHTGGIDHIPVHHNNEIAQSESAYGTPLANYWMHNEHLIIANGKMAKSGENFISLQTLKDRGIHPLAYRYYLMQTHYRSPLNFSWEALRAGQVAYGNLLSAFSALSDGGSADPEYKNKFEEALNTDLGTPEGIAVMWLLLKDTTVSVTDKRATILDFDRVLGLDIEAQSKIHTKEVTVPENIYRLGKEREKARKAKDFRKSDELRDQIESAGYEVMDTDSGQVIGKAATIRNPNSQGPDI